MNKGDSSNSIIVFVDLSTLSISCCSPKYNETFLKHILSVFATFFFLIAVSGNVLGLIA